VVQCYKTLYTIHLQQQRIQTAAHQLGLEQTAKAMDGGVDLGERLALDYGLAVVTAELAWVDSTLNRVSQPTLSVEAVQGDFATPAV